MQPFFLDLFEVVDEVFVQVLESLGDDLEDVFNSSDDFKSILVGNDELSVERVAHLGGMLLQVCFTAGFR